MDGARLYVGNLSLNTTERSLRLALEADGSQVEQVEIAGGTSGPHRGFAFVDMRSPSDCLRAIAAWNGNELDGRTILVADAKGRPERGVRAKTEFVVGQGARRRYR
jgi:RNA recognition motif-containing protein